MRRVPATIVAVEKQKLLRNLSVCICSLRYTVWNAHGPYCHLWPAELYNIFPPYLINDKILKKVIERKMCVSIFFKTFFWKISHSKKKKKRDMIKNIYWSSCKVPVIFFPVLTKLEVSWQIFEKILKQQISWKSVQWDPSCSVLQMDGQTWRS